MSVGFFVELAIVKRVGGAVRWWLLSAKLPGKEA